MLIEYENNCQFIKMILLLIIAILIVFYFYHLVLYLISNTISQMFFKHKFY